MRQVRVTVFEQEGCHGDWPPEAPAEFIDWWRAKIDQIPEEFRASARVRISSASEYDGGSSPVIEISYSRPETTDEQAKRIRREEVERAKRERNERADFERLKARFEAC